MTTFTITDLAAHGFDMSDISSDGWLGIGASPTTPVLVSDNGATALYAVSGLDPIAYVGMNYAFNYQTNSFFVEDFGFFNAQGDIVLFVNDINWMGSLTAAVAGIELAQINTLSDTFYGNSYADLIKCGPSDDIAFGAGGNDTLHGDAGNDSLDGGAGYDTAAMGLVGFRGVGVDLSGGSVVVTSVAGVDRLANVEVATFADGRLVFDANDPAARVARLYEAALDRLPDQAGLNFWIGAVQQGQPLSALASGFLASPEFQARFGGAASGDGAFVDQLYQNVLGRAGEAGGREFWLSGLTKGTGRADVLVAFSESAENKAGTAALVNAGIWDRSEAAAEVARMYDTVLGRSPDLQGLTFWKDALEGGTATPAQMADAFTASAEFRSKYGALGSRDFANALYVNTLDRPADQAGLGFWAGQLDAGVARSAVVLAFSESAEHTALTGRDIQSENPGEFGILFA